MRERPIAIATLALLAACSHDSDRGNPVDPQLTAPVQLQATLDDTTGHVHLSWTQYSGDQPFAAYVVLRNVARSLDVDTLAAVADIGTVAFTDTSLAPDTPYEYRVAVRNRQGFSQPSEAQRIDGIRAGAVELLPPVVDNRTGQVILRWHRYREPAFDAYTLHRRIVGTDADSVLTHVSDIADTSFVDATALHDVDYLYRVDVTAAGQTVAGTAREGRLDLPAVTFESLDFDSHTASASMTWSAYTGPRFESYRVERTTATTREIVRETQGVADTSWTDPGLRGDTQYEYRVVVITDRGETMPSERRGGAIYRFEQEWPLVGDHARLLSRGQGVMAIVTDLEGTDGTQRIVTFDGDGGIVADLQQDRPMLTLNVPAAIPEADGGWTIADEGLWRMGPTGDLPAREVTVFASDTVLTLSGPRSVVTSTVSVFSGGADVRFDSVRYWPETGEATLLDLDSPSGNEWDRTAPDFGIDFGDSTAISNFRLEADFLPDEGTNLVVGGPLQSRFLLEVREPGQLPTLLRLTWWYHPPPGVDEPADSAVVTLPFPFKQFHDRRYRLTMELSEGVLSLRLAQVEPLWERDPDQDLRALVRVGDNTLVAGVNAALVMDADGDVTPLDPPSDWVSEIRAWPVGRFNGFGVCQPAANKLRLGLLATATAARNWVTAFRQDLGPEIPGTTPLFYPLSFDVGPDRRLYVLEAGSARVLVFDADYNYITEFGGKGAGPGQFDVGTGGAIGIDYVGNEVEDELRYYGSIAVDDDGFIYVADMGNNRIQKFAP